MQRRKFITTVGAALVATFCGGAIAQTEYPERPIRWVLGYAAGGGTDTLIRGLAPRVGELLGTSVIIENRPGANGNLASEVVAKASPDGYTFLYNTSSVVVSPSLYSKVNFDPFRDFDPVSLVANIPLALAVHPSVPAQNLAELIAYAKANPDKLSYASAGAGNVTHLSNLLFQKNVGISAVHIPYKGGGPAMNDLVGGHVDFYMDTVNTAIPFIQSGHINVFAVTSRERLPQLPDIPTVAELAVPGFEAGSWSGLMAPKGTPEVAINKMYEAIRQALSEPEVRERFAGSAAEVRGTTPQEYATFLKDEFDRWGGIIREADVKLD